jgi:hypothetical protein
MGAYLGSVFVTPLAKQSAALLLIAFVGLALLSLSALVVLCWNALLQVWAFWNIGSRLGFRRAVVNAVARTARDVGIEFPAEACDVLAQNDEFGRELSGILRGEAEPTRTVHRVA